MKFLDLLRKLGILRWGAKAGSYASGSKRRPEFLMEGVFDAKKDLVGGAKDEGERKLPRAPRR